MLQLSDRTNFASRRAYSFAKLHDTCPSLLVYGMDDNSIKFHQFVDFACELLEDFGNLKR